MQEPRTGRGGRKRRSPNTATQSTPNAGLFDGPNEVLKTLQRQHKITLRKVEAIERQLEAKPSEAAGEDTPGGIVGWFLRLIHGRGRRDGTNG